MSDICSYCGVCSRNACSTYKKKYLADELRNCPNLSPDERLRYAGTPQDLEILRLMEENERLRSDARAAKFRNGDYDPNEDIAS